MRFLCLSLVGLICFGAQAFSRDMPILPPPGMFTETEDLRDLQEENPKLYTFKKRLAEIKEDIQKIIQEYNLKNIDKEEAYRSMLPLVKEKLSIQNNPEYLTEQEIHSKLSRQQGGPIPMMQ